MGKGIWISVLTQIWPDEHRCALRQEGYPFSARQEGQHLLGQTRDICGKYPDTRRPYCPASNGLTMEGKAKGRLPQFFAQESGREAFSCPRSGVRTSHMVSFKRCYLLIE